MLALLALMTTFTTMDEAAKAALAEAAACSQGVRECGGAIYSVAGRYTFSIPVPGKAFSVDFAQQLLHPPLEMSTVGDYHVHICSVHNFLFSPFFSEADTINNKGLHNVGYMLSLCDNRIRRFDPEQDESNDIEVVFKPHKDGTQHASLFLTSGHVCGWLP